MSTKTKKKPELQDFLQKDNYIDVYCIQNKSWRVARIIDVRDKEIEINYDGTNKKCNETIKTTSSKIAFCRRFSSNYTGDDYRDAKTSRDYFKYSTELCQQRLAELNDLMSTRFEGLCALDITYAVRVKQFLFLDLLLSQELPAEELPLALEYIKTYLDFIKFYFEFFPQFFSDIHSIQKWLRGQQNNDLYFIDERVAIAGCYQEICESFCMLFGSIWRLLKMENSFWYLNFNALQNIIDQGLPQASPNSFTSNPNIADWNLYQGATNLIRCIKKTWPYYLKVMGYFNSIGGLQAFENLLKVFEGFELPQIPLKALPRYYLTQLYLITFYQPNDQAQIAKSHITYLLNRVKNLSNQEIKDADIDTIKDVINEQSLLFKKAFTEDKLQVIVDEIQLNMAIRFLKSPYLEKRVKGITEIKEYCDTDVMSRKNKSVTKEQMIKWVKDNQILELLLTGESIHPELVKRCADVAAFLCRNNQFPIDLIEKIWQTNQGKHETTQLAVFDLFKQLSQYLNSDGIDRLYALISTIPYSEYSEATVQLLKTFTENALQKKQIQQSTVVDTRKFYGFNQLWDLLQDREEAIVPYAIQDLAFQSARSIVSNIPQSKAFLQTFFAKCFDLIRDHTSVYQAISFAHYILDKQFVEDPSGKKQIVRITNEKYNIVELFVKDIEVYLEKVRAFFKDQPTADVIISGVQTFQQNMFFRLQMLNYLLQMPELKISYEQLLRLWDAITVKTKGNIQKKELIKVLYTGNLDMQAVIQQRFFSDKDSQYRFFAQVLCNPNASDYQNFSMEEFDLFQVFFRTINLSKGALKFQIQIIGKLRVKEIDFEGKDALWELFAQVKDPKVLESVTNLLVTLYTSFMQNLVPKTPQIQQELMDRCLTLIAQPNASSQLTSRCINLILTLFNVFQQGPPAVKKVHHTKSNSIQFKAQVFIQSSQGQQQKLQDFKESDSMTFDQFKRKFAEQNQVAYKQVEIQLDNSWIENDFDLSEITLGSRLPSGQLRLHINPNYHPRNYLTQNPNTFNLLFKLLNSANGQFAIQVWELLNKLPTNSEVKESIRSSKNWGQFMNDTFYRTLYNVQIISDFVIGPQADAQWSMQFFNSGGYNALVQKYLQIQFKFTQNPLEKLACFKFTKLINHFLNASEDNKQLQGQVMHVIQALCDDLAGRESTQENPGQKKGKLKGETLQQYELETQLLSESLRLLNSSTPAGLNFFFTSERNQIISRLQVLLVENDNTLLKKELVAALQQYSYDRQILLTLLTGPIFDWVIREYKQKSEYFFQLTCELFRKESVNNITKYGILFDELTQKLIQSLQSLPIYEVTQKDQDQVLIGLFKFLQVLVEKQPHLRNRTGLLKEIFTCLLDNSQNGPKCKSAQSRAAAFNCIISLVSEKENLELFVKTIQPLHLTNQWRTKQFQDWNIQSKFNEKSSTGYVGLLNLGCICYMNSLLQQLFMIPSFREPLLAVENMSNAPRDDNVLFQLKCLFLALKHSQKQYYNPKKFCHAFKDFSGNPTNIFEQMDVDEFCNLLMDRIEAGIKGSNDPDLVKRNFGGVISNEIIGKTCPHSSEREEPFVALSLPVKNKKSIDQCLQSMIQGDLLEGDNAYHCEQCNKKVNAVKRMCLKKLPNHLIVVLKRFDFDFDLMMKAKINDRCEFPFKLDLQQYSQQGLRKAENRQQPDAEEYPPSYYEYKLSGVVIHMGTAESGHYYSFIQEREKDVPEDKRWYEFNDTFVTHIDQKEIITEGYGGEKSSVGKNKIMQFKDKSKNAYLLFYERIEKWNDTPKQPEPQSTIIELDLKGPSQKTPQAQMQDMGGQNEMVIESQGEQPLREQADLQLFLNEIKEENDKFAIQRFIFNPEYFTFMSQLIQQQEQIQNPDPGLVKVLLVFFLACGVRESERIWIGNNITSMKNVVLHCPQAAHWLLTCFCQPHYIREFQFECPIKSVRKYVITLLEAAILTQSKVESTQNVYQVDQFDKPSSIIAALINQWILCIREIRGSVRQYSEFFDLFYRFARISSEYSQYLLSKRTIGKLLDFYIEIVLNNQIKKPVSQFQEEVRRTEDIRTIQQQFNPLDFLGQLQQISTEAASHYDDLLEKKFEKNINYQLMSTRVYLWRTVSYLLKTAKVRNIKLSFDENELINQDQGFYSQLLEEGDSKLAIRQIADILGSLVQDNQKMSDVILNAIHKQIYDKEYKEYRKYFVVMRRIFSIKDQLQEYRMNFIMSQIFQLMQKQTQYFFETDICQQYIIRIAAKNPAFAKWMNANQQKWGWFLENISNQQTPNEKLMQNNFNPIKCLHRLHNIYLPINPSAYKKHFLWKKTVYQQLMKNEALQVPTTEFDSDDDLTNQPVKAGEKIDFYNTESNQWVVATVDKVMEDQLQITHPGSKVAQVTSIVDRDSEKLAPLNTLSICNKVPGFTDQSNPQVYENDNDTDEGNGAQSRSSESEDN